MMGRKKDVLAQIEEKAEEIGGLLAEIREEIRRSREADEEHQSEGDQTSGQV